MPKSVPFFYEPVKKLCKNINNKAFYDRIKIS